MMRWCWVLMLLAGVAVAAEAPPWLLGPGVRGATWQQDAAGIWRGTGSNRGQTWQQDAAGVWRGTGSHRGQTWQQDAAGVWRGRGPRR